MYMYIHIASVILELKFASTRPHFTPLHLSHYLDSGIEIENMFPVASGAVMMRFLLFIAFGWTSNGQMAF